jgi:enoyl-CoA hydratase
MEGSDFTLDWQGECGFFRLTRPAKRNAITKAILDGLEACCDDLDAGRRRALVITGDGDRAFCAGTDLQESAALGAEASLAKTERARNLIVRIHRASWTSIAALNGLAYGGGCELALACTFRVAAPGVRMAFPEIKIGVFPAYGGTQLLPALVGQSRALDLMLTGRAVDAQEALALGLVDRVVADPALLLDEATALAKAVLVHSQFAIDRIRRCVAAAGPVVTDEGLALEAQAFEDVMKSEDAKEGVLAFLEKRRPKFKHR